MKGLPRRHLLAGLMMLSGGTGAAAARTPLPQTPTSAQPPGLLIVAGPPKGRLDRWANLIADAVARSPEAGRELERLNIGGADGVTGANQFEARGAMDGSTALLVPGVAAISWLIGELRARFDPSRWVPILGGAETVVVLSRIGLRPGQTVRVAAPSLAGPELPVLLALEMIGIRAEPTSAQGADAYVVAGPAAAERMAGTGYQPVMVLGIPGRETQRDPSWPGLPTALELTRGRGTPGLQAALRAAIQAAQLDSGLILPHLAPASSVARWRGATLPMLEHPDLLNRAAATGAWPIPAASAAEALQLIASDPDSITALRRWLASRYGFAPV